MSMNEDEWDKDIIQDDIMYTQDPSMDNIVSKYTTNQTRQSTLIPSSLSKKSITNKNCISDEATYTQYFDVSIITESLLLKIISQI